jgi:hypothetical protein
MAFMLFLDQVFTLHFHFVMIFRNQNYSEIRDSSLDLINHLVQLLEKLPPVPSFDVSFFSISLFLT